MNNKSMNVSKSVAELLTELKEQNRTAKLWATAFTKTFAEKSEHNKLLLQLFEALITDKILNEILGDSEDLFSVELERRFKNYLTSNFNRLREACSHHELLTKEFGDKKKEDKNRKQILRGFDYFNKKSTK